MSLLLWSLAALAAEPLPIHRIRFYEAGVAWFERAGPVTDATTLFVPAGHLDDALKSLVVLGGDVEVGAVTFPSQVGDAAALTEAGLQEVGMAGIEQVLSSMIGGPVEIARPDAPLLRGTLLDVLTLAGPEDGSRPAPYALTVLGDDGALSRVGSESVTSVRSGDPEIASRLRRAARTLGPSQAKERSAIDLQMWRGGSVSLGYMAEAPVFRVTYRVVTDDSAPAQLQAWALVHNDTEEDWHDTIIEIANGEPDSFIHPLAAPRYAERELRMPDDGLSTVAQLVSATPDQLSMGGSYGYGTGSGGYGVGGGGVASSGGIGVGSVTALAALKEAEPVETPTQFIYRIGRPVDLPARHSALVPLVHDAIAVESLVAFLPSGSGRTGLWLTNTTDRTLPEGILSVLDGGGLAGESELMRLKPRESQMILFGNELDVELTETIEDLPARPSAVRWEEGLIVTETLSEAHTVQISNRSGRTRAVWLALPLPEGTDVVSGQKTVIDPQEGYTWTALSAPPGASAPIVRVEHSEERSQALDTLTGDDLDAWAKAKLGAPSVLRAAAQRRRLIEPIDAELMALRAEHGRASTQLDGFRQDLGAAPDNDTLARKAASAEEELRRLSERLSETEDERTAAYEALAETLEALSPKEADDTSGSDPER